MPATSHAHIEETGNLAQSAYVPGSHTALTYLILFQAAFRHHLVPLFLEGDNDQGHKDVDKEKREDHKVDHIEDGKLHPKPGAWPLLLIGGVHRVFQHPK